MFIVLLKYVKPIEEVEKFLDSHVEFLDTYYRLNKFILSGRRIPRTGGVILINVDKRSDMEQILTEDPFHKHKIAEYEVIEFKPTKYDSRFSCFVD